MIQIEDTHVIGPTFNLCKSDNSLRHVALVIVEPQLYIAVVFTAVIFRSFVIFG